MSGNSFHFPLYLIDSGLFKIWVSKSKVVQIWKELFYHMAYIVIGEKFGVILT